MRNISRSKEHKAHKYRVGLSRSDLWLSLHTLQALLYHLTVNKYSTNIAYLLNRIHLNQLQVIKLQIFHIYLL